jgi:hypothetical protein
LEAWRQLLVLNPADTVATHNVEELEEHLGTPPSP